MQLPLGALPQTVWLVTGAIASTALSTLRDPGDRPWNTPRFGCGAVMVLGGLQLTTEVAFFH